MYDVLKHNKRMWIVLKETGEKVYSPPNFIRHKIMSRDEYKALANEFSNKKCRDINAIIDFETKYNPRLKK